MKVLRGGLLFIVGLVVGLALCIGVWILRGPKSVGTAAEREQKFESMMHGAVLVGYSTTLKHPDKLSSEERYTIESVSKLAGNTWFFHARMKLGNSEIPMPIPVTIEWTADTPVLTMTNFEVPGMGSFTVRLVFYDGQYAGTWMGKDHGGQMFGRIVPVNSK